MRRPFIIRVMACLLIITFSFQDISFALAPQSFFSAPNMLDMEEKLARLVAIAENMDKPAPLDSKALAEAAIAPDIAVGLAKFANNEWRSVGSKRRFAADPAAGTLRLIFAPEGANIFKGEALYEKSLWKGVYDGAERASNGAIRKEGIEKGRAAEIRTDGSVVRIRRNRSNPRSPALEARFAESGILDKIRKARDPGLLKRILMSHDNFNNLNPKEQEKLLEEAQKVTFSVMLGKAALLKSLEGGITIYRVCHIRRNYTKHIHGLDPTIWIGEKLLEALAVEEIARIMLEEGQHIVRPTAKHWEDVKDPDPAREIKHDKAFGGRLASIARLLERAAAEAATEYAAAIQAGGKQCDANIAARHEAAKPIKPEQPVPALEFADATAKAVAEEIKARQQAAGNVNIILAQGNTMIGFLKKLAAAPGIDWSRVNIIQTAEFKHLPPDSAFSFKSYMQEHFIDFLPKDRNIPQKNIYNIADLGVAAYKKLLGDELRPHIAVLGIGMNGRIGINEPGTDFSSKTREVALADETVRSEMDGNPLMKMRIRGDGKTAVYTVGMSEIASAERIFLFANGRRKQDIVRKALRGPVTVKVPASMLQTVAEKVTVVLDDEAAAGLANGPETQVVDSAAVLKIFNEAGFRFSLDEKAGLEFLKAVGVKYIGAVLDSKQLLSLLKGFPESEKVISGPEGVEKFEKTLQGNILDYFIDHQLEVLSQVPDNWAGDNIGHINAIHKLFDKFTCIYEFPFAREKVAKRQYLLQLFILLNIRPPASGVGSVMRSAVARKLVLDEIFLSRDPGISEFAIAALVELGAMKGGEAYMAQLRDLLKDSKELPRFAMGMMDVIVNAERGVTDRMPEIKDREKFIATAIKIIRDLVSEDLKREKSYFTKKFLEYSALLTNAYKGQIPAATKLYHAVDRAYNEKEAKSRYVNLRVESVYKDYFETFYEFNLDLFVLLAKRMKAKRLSDAEGLERAAAEMRERLDAVKKDMAGFDDRLARLPAELAAADVHAQFRNAETLARDRHNESAANAVLVGACNAISKAREKISRSPLYGSRPAIGIFRRDDGKIVERHHVHGKIDEDAKTLVLKPADPEFDLRWQAGRSLDDREESELSDREAMKGHKALIDEYQAAADKGAALAAEGIDSILSNLEDVDAEPKRLARIALETVRELIELQETGDVKYILPLVSKYLSIRIEDIDRMRERIRRGRVEPFREIVTRDNYLLEMALDEVMGSFEAHHYGEAIGKLAALMNDQLKPYLAEPDLEGLKDLLGPLMDKLRELNNGVLAEGEDEDVARAKARFWANLARRKLNASQLLNEFMMRFRHRYAGSRIEKGNVPYLKEDTFLGVFDSFVEEKGLKAGSPYVKSLQMLCYLASFVSMKRKELFEAINTLRLIVEINDIPRIQTVKRLQRFTVTVAALEKLKPKNTVLNLDEKGRATLLDAVAKDFGLDDRGRFELEKAFDINKETIRMAFPADPFIKLYDSVKADPKILELSYEEKQDRLSKLPPLSKLTAGDMVFLKTLMEHYGCTFKNFAYGYQFEDFKKKELADMIDIEEKVTPVTEHQYDGIRRMAEQFIRNSPYLQHAFTHVGRLFGKDINLQYVIHEEEIGRNKEDAAFFRDFSDYGQPFGSRSDNCMRYLFDPMSDRIRLKVLAHAISLMDEFFANQWRIKEALLRLAKYDKDKAAELRIQSQMYEVEVGLMRDFFREIFRDEEESPVNMNESIRRIGDLCNTSYSDPSFDVPHFKVEYDLADDLPRFKARGFKLAAIWLNLMMNAEEAKNKAIKSVTLSVSTSVEKDPAAGRQNFKIVVSDNATGIKKEDLPRIFDKGFTTKGDKGTGLGLPIVKDIVESYGGTISVESRHIGEYPMTHGTTFTIRLPAGNSEPVKPASEDAQRLAAIRGLFKDGIEIRDGKQVLISEDLFDREQLVAMKATGIMGFLFKEGSAVRIMEPKEIHRLATNSGVRKDKMAIVLTKDDFGNEEIWTKTDKETSLRSSVVIIDDKMTGENYLYLEGVIGLAAAVMAGNEAAIKGYYRLISGVAVDDQILKLLKNDDMNNIAFALKAILKFKPITGIVDREFIDAVAAMEKVVRRAA